MTIVVPVKNRATLVLRTLNSIKAQTWRPLRLIVVDNASTDGTPDSVRQWIGKNAAEDFEVTLEEETKPGAAAARNRGLEAVDTRLMMFFDSDDIMAPEHVEKIMSRFHAGDDPDLVLFRALYHPISGGDRVTKSAGSDLMVTHLCHSLLRTAGFACETALARRAGGWNEALTGWDDLEFGTRVLLEARNRVFIPDVNVEVFARADSITGTQFISRKGEWEKALDRIDESLRISRHAKRDKWRRVVSYKKAILAASYRREGKAAAAEDSLAEALANPLLNGRQRLFLKWAYRYASLGGRGSALLVNLIL